MTLRSGERHLTKGAKLAIVEGTVGPSTALGIVGAETRCASFSPKTHR
jgi:hypothetical protein